MANENLIIFPNGRRLSEFALSGSVGGGGTGTVTGSGAINMVPKWTAANTLGSSSIIDYGGVVRFNTGLEGVSYIEAKSGATSLSLYYPYNSADAAISIRGNGDVHFGANSGFLRDNAGDIELHLKTGKKLKIVVA